MDSSSELSPKKRPGAHRVYPLLLAPQAMDKTALIKALQKDLAVVKSIRSELKALEAKEEQGYSVLDAKRMQQLGDMACQSHERLLETYYDETAW